MSVDNPEKVVRPMLRLRDLPLGMMLGFFLIADLVMATVLNPQGDEMGGIILGVTFTQVVMLAVWTALGPASLVTRTLTGFCGTILVALTLVACISRAGSGPQGWLFFGIVVAQWLVVQIPLWVFRSVFRWQLCWPGADVIDATRSDVQFGIGQLMAWTALVGVTLGIGRWLMPENLDGFRQSHTELVIIFTCLTVFNSLLAWPVVWSAFSPRWWPLWLVAAGLCCVGLTLAEIRTFQAAMGQGGDEDIFWIMNSLQAGGAAVALLTMRVSGFHMTRHTGNHK